MGPILPITVEEATIQANEHFRASVNVAPYYLKLFVTLFEAYCEAVK